MKELGKCVTAEQAEPLESLGIGIQVLVQLRDCNSQEGFLSALREIGVRSRDYSHTLRKPLLSSTEAALVVPATQYTHYTKITLPSLNNCTITGTLLFNEHTTERFTNSGFISLWK